MPHVACGLIEALGTDYVLVQFFVCGGLADVQNVVERISDALDRGVELAKTAAFAARSADFEQLRAESHRPWRERYEERLGRAIRHTDFYRSHSPADVPVLTRASLRANFARLIQTDGRHRIAGDGPLVLCRSSGSTGQSAPVLRSKRDLMVTHLLREDLLRRYHPAGEPIVCLSLEPENTATDEIKVQLVLNTRPCAGVLLPRVVTSDPEALGTVLRAVGQVDVISGSSYRVHEFARDCDAAGVKLRPHVIQTTYDILTPAMARHLRSAFNSPVHSVYGSAETDACGWSCDADRMHISHRFAYGEILRADDSAAQPGERGRLVLTPILSGEAMSLLRYDVGDEATWVDSCTCGEVDTLVLGSFRGRAATEVVGESGRGYHYGDFLDFSEFLGLSDFQYVSRERGCVALTLGPDDAHLLTIPGWSDNCLQLFGEKFRSDLGLVLTAGESFVRTPRGKRDLVVNLASDEDQERVPSHEFG